MPVQEKILADDQADLNISAVEQVLPEYTSISAPEEIDALVLKLFAPNASSAKDNFERRKVAQIARQKWLQTIVNNQNNLQLTTDRIRQLAANNNSSANGSNVPKTFSR